MLKATEFKVIIPEINDIGVDEHQAIISTTICSQFFKCGKEKEDTENIARKNKDA